MMDGSLEADGKTIASYDYNVDVTQQGRRHGARASASRSRASSAASARSRRCSGDKEDGHGTEATMTREQLLTDPEQAADFVKQTQLDALAIAIGTSHGAYKFTAQADRRHPRDRPHQGDPPPHPEHAPGDARLVERAAGPAGR